MKIIIDDELKALVAKDWVKNVLRVVDPNMLTDLTIRIIDPSKHDKYQEIFSSPDSDWGNEKVRKELSRRRLMGFSPDEKIAELYIRRGAWIHYTARREYAKVLYHEIYHANDPNRDEDWEPKLWQDPVWNHPREVRARAFMDKTYRCLKDKRKVIMTNAEVGGDILDKKPRGNVNGL